MVAIASVRLFDEANCALYHRVSTRDQEFGPARRKLRQAAAARGPRAALPQAARRCDVATNVDRALSGGRVRAVVDRGADRARGHAPPAGQAGVGTTPRAGTRAESGSGPTGGGFVVERGRGAMRLHDRDGAPQGGKRGLGLIKSQGRDDSPAASRLDVGCGGRVSRTVQCGSKRRVGTCG